jgi:hypothetical protein
MKAMSSDLNCQLLFSFWFRILTKKRQYGEIVMPLQAVMEVMKHFHNYMDIPQIKQLAHQVHFVYNKQYIYRVGN